MRESGESLPKATSWSESSCYMNSKSQRRSQLLRQSLNYLRPSSHVNGLVKRRYRSFQTVQAAAPTPSKPTMNASFTAAALRGKTSSEEELALSFLTRNETSESGWTAYFNSSSDTRTTTHRNATLDNVIIKQARDCLVAQATVSKLRCCGQRLRPMCDDSSMASDASSGPASSVLPTQILEKGIWNGGMTAESHVPDGGNQSCKRTVQAVSNEQRTRDFHSVKHIKSQSSIQQMLEGTRRLLHTASSSVLHSHEFCCCSTGQGYLDETSDRRTR